MGQTLKMLLLAGFAVMLAGCSTVGVQVPHNVEDSPKTPHPHAVILLISNQSQKVDPVDILVTMDGRKILQGEFQFGNGHIFKTFEVYLNEGIHSIRAQTERGKAFLYYPFKVPDKRCWLVLCYDKEGGEGRFSVSVHDEEPGII